MPTFLIVILCIVGFLAAICGFGLQLMAGADAEGRLMSLMAWGEVTMDARLTAGLFVVGVPAACALIIFGAILLSLIRGQRHHTATMRQRIGAAYNRSGWARAAIILATVLIFWAGMILIMLLAPLGTQPVACALWLLLVAFASSWYVVL